MSNNWTFAVPMWITPMSFFSQVSDQKCGKHFGVIFTRLTKPGLTLYWGSYSGDVKQCWLYNLIYSQNQEHKSI